MESMLTLATDEPVRKNTVRKYKIICIVSTVLNLSISSFVTNVKNVSLHLNLFVLLFKYEILKSCRRKCFDSSFRGKWGCRCDEGCRDRNDCCWDFTSVCVDSTQIWSCSSFRCGEGRQVTSLCSCAEDCTQKQDCCANYKSICQGTTPWVKENCTTAEQTQCPEGFDLPPVILFSMDGNNFLISQQYFVAETCGIHSKYMRAVYPTKTFPNHYSIVTGLYPESHGIIDNNMYDVQLNKNFSLSSKEKNNPAWWKGQPIWLTAMYQGLKAATYFWPGSDVAINGSFPTIYKNYDGKISYEERVSTLLKWLDLPKAERPSLYTIYVEEPDSAGHDEGPVSGRLIKALQLVDSTFGLLMEGLKQRNLHNCVNIILLADHGMDQTSCGKVEYMTDYFPQINFYMYEGPAPRIRTRNIPEDFFSFNSEEIVEKLSVSIVSLIYLN
uniref:Ectonucleotide pyrophosphatase/phosphodiesterase family member 3 n=1 Tax=Sciurus vulgaris TaxID=55149 RepID=A0A8D2CTZ8_SCIVU